MNTSITAITEERLRLFKNYPTEILFVLMFGMLLYQGNNQSKLESKVDTMSVKLENYYLKDHQAMLKAMAESTQALKDNTKVMNDVSDYLRIWQTREALKD